MNCLATSYQLKSPTAFIAGYVIVGLALVLLAFVWGAKKPRIRFLGFAGAQVLFWLKNWEYFPPAYWAIFNPFIYSVTRMKVFSFHQGTVPSDQSAQLARLEAVFYGYRILMIIFLITSILIVIRWLTNRPIDAPQPGS